MAASSGHRGCVGRLVLGALLATLGGSQCATAAAPTSQPAQPPSSRPAGKLGQPPTSYPAGQLGRPPASQPAGQPAQPPSEEQAPQPAHITSKIGKPPTFGPLVTDTAIPAALGSFALQLYWVVQLRGGSFDADWERSEPRPDFVSLTIPLQLTLGPAPRTEVDLIMPYVQNWAFHLQQPGVPDTVSVGGLGDFALEIKYQALKFTKARPAVTPLVVITFPVGRHFPAEPTHGGAEELGAGAYTFTLGVNASHWVPPVILYGNLWYTVSTSSRDTVVGPTGTLIGQTIQPRDQVTFDLAAEYPFGRSGRWTALLELLSAWDVGPIFTHSSEPYAALLTLLPGIEYAQNSTLAYALGVAFDFAGRNTPFTYAPILSFIYSP